MLGGAFLAALAARRVNSQIEADIDRLVAGSVPLSTTVTEGRLATLPAPAQRYLRHAGVVGKPVPRLVRVRQNGRLRSRPDARWMPFTAEQVYSVDPPAFVWRAGMPSLAMPLVAGRD